MSNYPKTKAEQIVCPECEAEQTGTIDLTTWPWNTYIHTCTNCGYLIMESEWNFLSLTPGSELPGKIKEDD